MFQIRLPYLKKYQNIAGVAGGIGFVLGTAIPGIGILSHSWRCPFGDGIFQTLGFVVVTGIVSAIVLGNLVAFLLMRIVKYQVSRKTSQREGDPDGN